jgi:hypothetical protein
MNPILQATKAYEQVETKGVTRKSYRINLPVIGWTEWKVYTPDAYLDDCAWLATLSVNYTVVFKD